MLPSLRFNRIFPEAYEPLEGEERKMKTAIDSLVYYIWLKIPQESELTRIDKCIWFLQSVEDECIKELEDQINSEEDPETLGKLLHKVVRRALPQIERVTWDHLPDNADYDPLSVENWHHKAYHWMMTKCGADDGAHTLEQLRTWKKPKHVSVHDNWHYMVKVNSAIPFMSQSVKSLDKKELKRCFFESHPYAWKHSFKEIHGFPDEEKNTIGEILSYMQLKAADAARRERMNHEQQKRESRNNRSPKRKANNNGDNSTHTPKKNRSNNQEERLSSEEYNKRCQRLAMSNPNDVCTLRTTHRNHKIGECTALNKWKQRQSSKKSTDKSATESNAIHCMETDSATSKESNGTA